MLAELWRYPDSDLDTADTRPVQAVASKEYQRCRQGQDLYILFAVLKDNSDCSYCRQAPGHCSKRCQVQGAPLLINMEKLTSSGLKYMNCQIAFNCVGILMQPDLHAAQVTNELRERNFGRLELQSHEKYVSVWTEDTCSADYRPPGFYLFCHCLMQDFTTAPGRLACARRTGFNALRMLLAQDILPHAVVAGQCTLHWLPARSADLCDPSTRTHLQVVESRWLR